MTDLALPDPKSVTLARIPQAIASARAALAVCRETRDEPATTELYRRLLAYEKYVTDKGAREAFAAETRRTEILIGQLLGPGNQGARTDLELPTERRKFEELTEPRKAEFRQLAAAADLAHKLIDEGATSRAAILRELGRRDRDGALKPVEFPEGEFPVLYADPPWRYEHPISDSRKIENQYPTLDLDEIKALPVPAASDCVLYLWATSPKLAEAIEVVEAWGFLYRTSFVWVKDRIGPGYWARSRHELLLVATRGNPPTPEPSLRPDSVIEAPRGKHSEKPEEVYPLLERMFPNLPLCELFLRGTPYSDRWSGWGNQAVAA